MQSRSETRAVVAGALNWRQHGTQFREVPGIRCGKRNSIRYNLHARVLMPAFELIWLLTCTLTTDDSAAAVAAVASASTYTRTTEVFIDAQQFNVPCRTRYCALKSTTA